MRVRPPAAGEVSEPRQLSSVHLIVDFTIVGLTQIEQTRYVFY